MHYIPFVCAFTVLVKLRIHLCAWQGYGGLRGAVAFCLVAMLDANEIPQKYIFQTAVFAVILFTVFFQVGRFVIA
jgi:NhaP-type Na+/H+ or K+/H+ antiporter